MIVAQINKCRRYLSNYVAPVSECPVYFNCINLVNVTQFYTVLYFTQMWQLLGLFDFFL